MHRLLALMLYTTIKWHLQTCSGDCHEDTHSNTQQHTHTHTHIHTHTHTHTATHTHTHIQLLKSKNCTTFILRICVVTDCSESLITLPLFSYVCKTHRQHIGVTQMCQTVRRRTTVSTSMRGSESTLTMQRDGGCGWQAAALGQAWQHTSVTAGGSGGV